MKTADFNEIECREKIKNMLDNILPKHMAEHRYYAEISRSDKNGNRPIDAQIYIDEYENLYEEQMAYFKECNDWAPHKGPYPKIKYFN